MADDGIHKNVLSGANLAPNDIDASGDITAAGDITATGDLTATDDLVATDDVTAGDDLISTDDVTVGDDLVVTGVTTATGGLKIGTSENLASGIKGAHLSATVAVAVPTIADGKFDGVDVDISASLTMQPAVGDVVIAIPQEALPSTALLAGCYVTATDHATVTFGAQEGGGGVTGANKNFKFLVLDLT